MKINAFAVMVFTIAVSFNMVNAEYTFPYYADSKWLSAGSGYLAKKIAERNELRCMSAAKNTWLLMLFCTM